MPVHYELRDLIARVTIDRPEVLNAVDAATEAELNRIWTAIEADREARAMVLTGAGERAFCAGADMKGGSGKSGLEYWGGTRPGGFEMVMGCDIVVAAEHATFSLPEARAGRLQLDGGMTLLRRPIPFRAAMAVLPTGRRVKAPEALSLGIVNEVVPMAELDAAVERWLADILACAPLSVRAIKHVIRRTAPLSAGEAQAQRLHALVEALVSEDSHEGVRAFFEKRKPVWRGR